MTTTSDSSPSNAGDETLTKCRYLPPLPASSYFSLLTGLFLLLAFCFLPWLDPSVSCSQSEDRYYRCGGGNVVLQPAAPLTGLLLASSGATVHSVTLFYRWHSPDSSDFDLHPNFRLTQPDQFRFPFLWLPFASGLLWLLLPLIQLIRKAKLSRRVFWISLLVQLTSIVTILAFFINAFFAFPLAKAFLTSVRLPEGVEEVLRPELSTSPTAGVFLLLLMILAGSILYWWAFEEEKQPQQERFACRLAHLEDVERRGRVTMSSYSTFPLEIMRPERGARRISLVCPRCAEELELSVKSKPRLWWYRLGVLATVVAIMELPFWLAGPSLGQNPEPAFTGLLVCAFGAFVVLLLFIGKPGAKVVSPSKLHSIR